MVAVRYYRNHGEALFRFIDDPDVPMGAARVARRRSNGRRRDWVKAFPFASEVQTPVVVPVSTEMNGA